MQVPRTAFSGLAFLGLSALRRSPLRAGVVLLYHRVGDPQGDPARELVPQMGTDLFEAQLEHLRRRYRVVPASRILDEVSGRRRGQRFPVSITFDDDLASHAAVALPILRRLGLPATFFLSGASLEQASSFWWERLQALFDHGDADRAVASLASSGTAFPDRENIHAIAGVIEALSPEERSAIAEQMKDSLGAEPPGTGMKAGDVRALTAAGFEIGFHTLRHDRLTTVDDTELRDAMSEGRAKIERAAGHEIKVIAYPHGKADARVAAAARVSGYSYGLTGYAEPVRPQSDPMLLGRIEPSFGSVGELALRLVRTLAR